MKSFTSRISESHKSGRLFAHMLEFPVETEGTSSPLLGNLLGVMAKKPGGTYLSVSPEPGWHHEFITTEHGITGLSTTALKTEFPVRLWTEGSNVGLLMDTAKPVLVSSGDNYTANQNGRMDCLAQDPFPELMKMQGVETYTLMDLVGEHAKRVSLAEPALTTMWEKIRQVGWKNYFEWRDDFPGVNEVNVTATIPDICCIVVHNDMTKKDRSYADSVKRAMELKHMLIEHYPEQFDASLPIMEYKISRGVTPDAEQARLTELTAEQLTAMSKQPKGLRP